MRKSLVAFSFIILCIFTCWIHGAGQGSAAERPAGQPSRVHRLESRVYALESPVVDERVELLSIVARMAGFQEYNDSSFMPYVKAIHQQFDPYRQHPVILLARQLRDSMGLGFDGVMSMAVHLSPPPALVPVVAFNDTVPDKRWGPFKDRFVGLLKQFYIDAHCAEFFAAQRPLYDSALRRYMAVYDLLDVAWYQRFYGLPPRSDFHVVLGVGNGGGNYGPKVVHSNGKEDVFAIEGVWDVDSGGLPRFPLDSYLPTLIHEFNHSFINYLTLTHLEAFKASGALLYDSVEKLMRKQAYADWSTMLSEALVRAAVVRYLMAHPGDGQSPRVEAAMQVRNGFWWLRELVDLLGDFEADRAAYPTLEAFLPKLIQFYDTAAADMADYRRRVNQRIQDSSIMIASIGPFRPGDTVVRADLTEIAFTFDRPIVAGRYSFGPTKAMGVEHYPKVLMPAVRYSADGRTLFFHVSLKPNTVYQMYLNGNWFLSTDGYPARNFTLNFKTGSSTR